MAPVVVSRADEQPRLVVLVSTRAVLTQPDDSLVLSPATITISPATGKIVGIVPEVRPASDFDAATTQYVDYSPQLLLPGLVDAHVHLNEPGRTEWEGFATGTRAAAAGGVTTVVDMPLNAIPPTTTAAGFRAKLAAAQGQCWVDVGFYGGVIPGNAAELLPLVDMGVRGFKGFLIHSGVDEFPAVSSRDVALAMDTLQDADTTLMFHAEMLPPEPVDAVDAVDAAPAGALDAYDTFLASRPPRLETCALEEIVGLAAQLADPAKLHLHIVHLSATECIPILRAARDERGIRITAETCFHYLALAADDIAAGDTRHKCCPPIRSQINQDGLWAELARPDSVLSTVVSDHSPCTPQLKLLPSHLQAPGPAVHLPPSPPSSSGLLTPDDRPGLMRHSDSGIDVTLPGDAVAKLAGAKPSSPPTGTSGVLTLAAADSVEENRGDFFAAWGGISSVGLGLPILFTEAQRRRKHASHHGHNHSHADISILDIVRLCCQATARQIGLAHRKGGLRVGLDADVCVFDDAAPWTLSTRDMQWKNRCSPWEGHAFAGRVRATWLRGQAVYEHGGAHGGFVGGQPVGQPLLERRGKQVASPPKPTLTVAAA